METTIHYPLTAHQPCSLVEFLIGDGVNPGWLDKRVSARGSASVDCDRRGDRKDDPRQERGIAKWQTWEGDGETPEISRNFPPSQLDILQCPAPGPESMVL